jgi:hypothetical protein
MIKLKIILPLFILLCTLNSEIYGQHEKDSRLSVGVVPFDAKDHKFEKFAEILKEDIFIAIHQENRFLMVDIDKEGRKRIINNQSVRSIEWIYDQSINPKYTLLGTLSSLKFVRLNSGKGGYKCTATYTLKLADTETGEIVYNGSASFRSSESKIGITPESAFQNAVSTTLTDLKTYILKSFPIEIEVGKIEKFKKDKALEVIIKGGEKYGVEEKMKFEVFYLDESLGEPLPRYFAEIEVIRVLNENYSLAKVTKGQKELFNFFNSQKKIYCKNL